MPFADRTEALRFFGGRGAWVDGLEERDGGLWPRFDLDGVLRVLGAAPRDRWRDWEAIRSPTLVVVGEKGVVPDADLAAMLSHNPRAQAVQVAAAGHDPHLDRPEGWRRAAEPFVSGLVSR